MKFKYITGSGSAALDFGLKCIQAKKNSKILVPDYICNDVIICLEMNHLKPVFYRINKKFEPEWNSLQRTLKKNITIKYFLGVNYFGFPTCIEKIKMFCKKNSLIYIEDNAHGYGGIVKGKELGTFGDIGISSPRKILNLETGGVLHINYMPYAKKSLKINLSKHLSFKSLASFLFSSFYRKLQTYRQKKLIKLNYLPISCFKIIYKIDFISYFIIKNANLLKIKNQCFKTIMLLTKNPSFKKLLPLNVVKNKKLCPWAVPLLCKNKNQKKILIAKFHKKGIPAFSWPRQLPNATRNISQVQKRWEKLVCIPCNFDYGARNPFIY